MSGKTTADRRTLPSYESLSSRWAHGMAWHGMAVAAVWSGRGRVEEGGCAPLVTEFKARLVWESSRLRQEVSLR